MSYVLDEAPHGSLSLSSAYDGRALIGQAVGARCVADPERIGLDRSRCVTTQHEVPPMEHSLSFATWFWLVVPMSGIVLLSVITYLMGK